MSLFTNIVKDYEKQLAKVKKSSNLEKLRKAKHFCLSDEELALILLLQKEL